MTGFANRIMFPSQGRAAPLPPLKVYSTTFQTVENPLATIETPGGLVGSQWLNGGTDGLDWFDMKVATPGQCYGLQHDSNATDGTAILKGPWRPNQRAYARIFNHGAPAAGAPEVEIRLRSFIGPHVNQGYECDFSLSLGPPAPYIAIVLWRGAVGDFVTLAQRTDLPSPVDGDVIEGRAIGSVISCWINSVMVLSYDTASDPLRFASGEPGIGHNSPGSITNNPLYGFENFTAEELAA